MNKVSLDKVATFYNGRAFKPEEWQSKGLPIIRIQNLTGSSDEINYFDGEYHERNLIHRGDILISWSASLGVYIWQKQDALLNQHIFKVELKDSIQKNYFYHAATHLLNEMKSHVHGSTMQHITKDRFDVLEIPLPKPDEQKRIAAILDKADRLRRWRRFAQTLSDSFLQSVFIKMFGDPVCNTMSWPSEAFNKVCKARLGKMLDEKRQTGKENRLYLRNTNVQWSDFDLREVHQMDFDEKDRKEFRLLKGDILICEGGEIGRSAIWNDQLPECYFQKALHRARPNREKTVAEYIVHLMWTLARRNGFAGLSSQATIAHLTGEKLDELQIPLPPLPLQEKFAAIVQKFERIRQQQREATRQAEHLFQTLLHRAFRGEL